MKHVGELFHICAVYTEHIWNRILSEVKWFKYIIHSCQGMSPSKFTVHAYLHTCSHLTSELTMRMSVIRQHTQYDTHIFMIANESNHNVAFDI